VAIQATQDSEGSGTSGLAGGGREKRSLVGRMAGLNKKKTRQGRASAGLDDET